MLRVGLTGGIASGKSTVSQFFANQKIDIIDADLIARQLFAPGSPLLTDLKEHFGSGVFDHHCQLDRKKLGSIVFKDPVELDWLNSLTHPKVREEISRQLALASSPYVIIDIPLLVDKHGKVPSHLRSLIDRVLVVDLPLESQIERLISRDQIDREAALAIISNQSSREQKLAIADDIVNNGGTKNELTSQLNKLHIKYSTLSQSNAS